MDLKQDVVIPIYSSGTVHSLDDMARLRYLPNIHGVIIGRALMQRSFSLREVLEVAAQGADSPERESETAVSVLGIQRPLKVYLAAYNLSQAARWWNLDLRQSITDDSPYVEICIPQEDLNIDPKQLRPRDVQAAYEMAIDEADAVVVVLDGIENEAWTGFECGYARARGKQLLGIVCEGDAEYSESCARFEAMCDEVVRYDAGEDRATVFVDVAKELNSRLLSNAVGDATLIDDSEGRRQQQTT
jgi:nucleoside 2-deoxyribosyltransferase